MVDVAQVHVDAALTNFAIGYIQEEEGYYARKFSPLVSVSKKSDKYFKFNKSDFMRNEVAQRQPGTLPAQIGFRLSNETYNCEERAIRVELPDEILKNADLTNLDQAASRLVAQQIAIDWDRQFTADFLVTSTWTGSTTGGDITPGTLWTTGGSTPIADIRAQIRSIKKKTGRKPNKLLLMSDVWDVLADHADLTGRINGGATADNPVVVMPKLLGNILGLEVLIADSVYDSAVEGATASQAFTYSAKDALLAYVDESQDIFAPTAMKTFFWNEFDSGSGEVGVRRYRDGDEGTRKDWFEGLYCQDNKITDADAGVFFSNVIA